VLSLGPFPREGGIGIWELEPEPLGGDIFPTFPKIMIPPEIVPIETDLI
jgi:hypothetical protein